MCVRVCVCPHSNLLVSFAKLLSAYVCMHVHMSVRRPVAAVSCRSWVKHFIVWQCATKFKAQFAVRSVKIAAIVNGLLQ